MCQTKPDRPVSVRDVCTDEIGVLALSLSRFIAAGYMTRDVDCWESAHDLAEAALGAVGGPIFVAAITGIMRAIRAERSEDWPFMPASCSRLTPAEEQFVLMLAAARAGEDERLAVAVRMMTGGTAQRLRSAAFVAADLMRTHASFQVEQSLVPKRLGDRPATGRTFLH